MAPTGDMPTVQAMAQSFSLANMVPQAPEHNRGAWAKSVEMAHENMRHEQLGDVYVIFGPAFEPGIAQSPSIGPGQVRVPKYLFKPVYVSDKNRAWVHWHLNDKSKVSNLSNLNVPAPHACMLFFCRIFHPNKRKSSICPRSFPLHLAASLLPA